MVGDGNGDGDNFIEYFALILDIAIKNGMKPTISYLDPMKTQKLSKQHHLQPTVISDWVLVHSLALRSKYSRPRLGNGCLAPKHRTPLFGNQRAG